MSVSLDFYWALTKLKEGKITRSWGSLDTPKTTVLSSDTGADYLKESYVTAGQTVSLWDYTLTNNIGILGIEVKSNGPIDIAIKADKPTSSTDITPLGTHVIWSKLAVQGYAVFFIDTTRAFVHATPATYAATPFPGGLEVGRVYEVQAKNPGTASARIETFAVN